MQGYYTYPGGDAVRQRPKRIAVVTQGVKLGDETRGYTRFRFLSELLVREGFEVDLITSTFQHWDKAQRDTTRSCYQNLPYHLRFVYEPGYKRNLDLARINSHRVFAHNLKKLFDSLFLENSRAFDLIYSEIPPNNMARTCAEAAVKYGIPYVADVNDLWPEAMRMAVDIPIVSDIAFAPFARDAKRTYNLMSGAVGTSEEYTKRPASDREEPYASRTVYVGNQLDGFDSGAAERGCEVEKPEGEIWITYAGTLGASYDIATLIDAAVIAKQADSRIRVKLLGDGPDREKLQQYATEKEAPVDFVGYAPYDLMAAYLCASDITVNSLVLDAAQSIVTKIGDYLAASIPMINTGSSPEFRAKVENDGFGLNVPAENPEALAEAMLKLADNENLRAQMGALGRKIAEEQFDQKRSYLEIVSLIRELL
ncbi:MAG: glycosyltransferase family 4 protein [Eggerthellaceae bacterium]|nr:glycosyltransferase family 4 protein [Eggerthellaceae bacterium]